MITYRFTKSLRKLVTTDDSEATVEASQIVTYSSKDPINKKYDATIIVKGVLKEKNISYPVEWEFIWPENNVSDLTVVLGEILLYVDGRTTDTLLHKEAYVDVYDWFRIGWVDEKGIYYAYIEFKKDLDVLRAKVADYVALSFLKDVVASAVRN